LFQECFVKKYGIIYINFQLNKFATSGQQLARKLPLDNRYHFSPQLVVLDNVELLTSFILILKIDLKKIAGIVTWD